MRGHYSDFADSRIRPVNHDASSRSCWGLCGNALSVLPNKQSLLSSVLENHLNTVTAAAERACEHSFHKPLSGMMREMVEAFVDIKIERADISLALYRVSAEVGGPPLVKKMNERLRRAIERMIATASDAESSPDKFAIETMLAAMSGAMRSVLQGGASPATMRKLREHLVLLCQSALLLPWPRIIKMLSGKRRESVSLFSNPLNLGFDPPLLRAQTPYDGERIATLTRVYEATLLQCLDCTGVRGKGSDEFIVFQTA